MYETSLQPNQPENFLDNFDTADEALAYVNDPANEAELLEEEDAQDTHTHWSNSFDNYDDFMAAVNGDTDDQSDDQSTGDLSDPAYRDFIINATEEELAEYEATHAKPRNLNFLDNFDTAAAALAYINDPANEAEILEE